MEDGKVAKVTFVDSNWKQRPSTTKTKMAANTKTKDQNKIKPRTSRKTKGNQKKDDPTNSNDDTWKCELCKDIFDDPDCKMLECEYCEEKFCTECLDMEDDEYKLMTNRQDLHWFCQQCQKKAMMSIKTEKEIEDRCNAYCQKVEDRLRSVEEKVKEKPSQVEVKDMIKEELQSNTNRKIIREEIQMYEKRQNRGPIPDAVKLCVDEAIDDYRDRETRKLSLIAFNIEESQSENPQTRKSEDIRHLKEILENGIGVKDIEITEAVRIGRRENITGGKKILKFKVNSIKAKKTFWQTVRN